MKASELIKELQKLIELHGDHPIRAQNGDRDGSVWVEVDEVLVDQWHTMTSFNLDTMW